MNFRVKEMVDFKIRWNGIEWGYIKETDEYAYYFYWFDWISVKKNRMWGLDYIYYDGPHYMLCFWYFCVCWSTPWTKMRKKDEN